MESMEKVLLLSDSHRDISFLEKLPLLHPEIHIFWHCGDSELPSGYMRQWINVQGNCDAYQEYPAYQTITLAGHRFLLVHGDRYLHYASNCDRLVQFAHQQQCTFVCFGHTHVYMDQTVDGIRLLNPGSIRFPRDDHGPSYMILDVGEDGVQAHRMTYL